MTPTNELRFVERHVDTLTSQKIVRILQQKWIDPRYPEYPKWLDVPIEKEQE